MPGVQACEHFAGVVGVNPKGLTLRRLWSMASGRIKQTRFEMVELARLAWSMDQIDLESYLYFGQMEETNVGGPVQLSPEVEKKVQEEVKRMRENNPDLPKFKAVKT